MDGRQSREELFKLEDFVPHRNTYIYDDSSGIADQLMKEFPKTTEKPLMNHVNLRYDKIKEGNKGACLDYNLIGICNDANCSYQHTKTNPTAERINAVKAKLYTAIASHVK